MAEKKHLHYAWIVCCGCFVLMIFTTPLVNSLSSLYLKPITEEFDISRSAFTFTSTLVAICCMLLSPLWGKVFSQGNMKIILTFGLLVFALSYISYSWAQNKYHLYMSALGVGIAYSGIAFIPVSMLITSWFKKRRGLAMSIAFSGIGFGGSILSQVVTQLIILYGWRTAYRCVGLMVVLVAVPVAFFLLRQTPECMGLKPYGADSDPSGETEKKKDAVGPELDVPLSEAKTMPFFWVHMAGMFLIGLICSAPLRHINPYVSDLHGPAFAAAIVSLYSFVGIFGKLTLGWLNDKLGTIKGSLFAFSLMALTFTLLLLGKERIILYMMGVVYGIGNGVGTVLAPLLISATFGTKNFNLMCGITRSPMQLGMSLGGLLLAAVFDLTGSYASGWWCCIVLSLVAAACFAWSYGSSRKIFANRLS